MRPELDMAEQSLVLCLADSIMLMAVLCPDKNEAPPLII